VAGGLAWYGLALCRLGRFRRLLRHADPAPESLRQRARKLAEKMGLRRFPDVWLVPGRVAPMLWAAGGRPRILFPAALLGRIGVEQQNALLVHELAHLRRRDHWVRWLEFVAAGLYWWNPVLWLARRELRGAEEQCCDAWVTSTLPGAGRAYASALLETLDFLSDAPPAAPLLASGVGRVSDLKRRLTMIMCGTTPRALGWRGGLAVAGLGGLLLAVLPAWARAQAPPRPEPKPDDGALRFIIRADPATDADADKAVAELKALEEQLRKKQAEVQDLVAKIQAMREKLAAGADRKRTDGDGERRIIVEADGNVKYDNLKDLLKQLQGTTQGGSPVHVIVLDKASGKIIMEAKPENAPKPPPAGVPVMVPEFELRLSDGKPGAWVIVPKDATEKPLPPAGVRVTPSSDADKRIDELERKLKAILDEVEQLRHERRESPKPDADGKPLHSYGPAPVEFVPYIELFKKSGPAGAEAQVKELAAAREALHKQLEDLRARAEEEKAGGAAVDQAKAVVDAALAALKEAEARNARAEVLVKEGAVAPADLEKLRAEVAARQAQVEKAKLDLAKAAAEQQAREEQTQEKIKAAEANRQAAEAKLKELEARLRELQERTGDDGKKKP
jgi:hypothetical protein